MLLVMGTIGSLVPLGHWYHWVIGNIGSLVSLGRWYNWVIGTVGSLVPLNYWLLVYHWVIGTIVSCTGSPLGVGLLGYDLLLRICCL